MKKSIIFFVTVILSQLNLANPRVSIIATINNNDDCIESFLFNLYSQSIFYDADIIFIDANSPGNEDKIIKKYLKSFSNIRYVRINENLSHSALLNLGIKYAFAPLITHTYIHDRRTIFSLEEQVSILEKNPEIDLVYADYCITNTLNAPWFDDIQNFTQIKVADPVRCPRLDVGTQPVWRKSIYFSHGFFKEDGCGCTTDQMWAQLINAGSIIVKAPHISGLCYFKK